MTTREPSTMHTQASYSPDELARRSASSKRMAWLLGAAVLAIYLVGLFFKR